MIYTKEITSALQSRLPYGGRGLKFLKAMNTHAQNSRLPYGGRGLKYKVFDRSIDLILSPPVWGAWIEIALPSMVKPSTEVASRMGGVD